MNMCVHAGGKRVDYLDLNNILIPEETKTYKPVSHMDLVDKIITISKDLLTDYNMTGEDYALARNGNQLFALFNFQHKEVENMALAIATRNSYDQSMSVGLAAGANVFICSNMALTGDIAVMKKHTRNVMASLENEAISMVYKSKKTFNQICHDAENMYKIPLTNRQGFEAIGLLFGEGLLTPRQLPIVKAQWLKPDYEEFQPRTLWSFYNACTQALKSTPPREVMERHIDLHQIMTNYTSKTTWTLP